MSLVVVVVVGLEKRTRKKDRVSSSGMSCLSVVVNIDVVFCVCHDTSEVTGDTQGEAEKKVGLRIDLLLGIKVQDRKKDIQSNKK